MYCDDSRVTQVDPKEVVVSLQRYLSLTSTLADVCHPLGQTRLHLILQEDQSLNYTLIFLHIFTSSFLASFPYTPHPCRRVIYYIQSLQLYRLWVTTKETNHGKWICV